MIVYNGSQPPFSVGIAREDGLVVGAGFLIAADTLLTCAHVVRDAVAKEGSKSVTVRLAGDESSTPIEAHVIKSPNADGDHQSDDVAVLRLPGKVTGFAPNANRLADRADMYNQRFSAFGFPDGSTTAKMVGDNATVTALGYDGRGLVQLAKDKKRIVPGYSGAAVREANDIVGMLVTSRLAGEEAFMIPAPRLHQHARRAVPELEVELTAPTTGQFPHTEVLKNFVRSEFERADKTTVHGNHPNLFASEAALCASTEEIEMVHRGEASQLDGLNPRDFLSRVLGKTTFLQAPGGAGKSFFLLRLLLSGIDAGYVPFFLDVQDAGTDEKVADENALSKLFGGSTQAGGSWTIFESASQSKQKLLVVVDGLNEAAESTKAAKTLDFLARNHAPLTLVIADRMSPKHNALFRQYCLATMLPLSDDVVRTCIPSIFKSATRNFRKLLSTPFFLAIYQQIASKITDGKSTPRTRADVMFAYFALCRDSAVNRSDMVEVGKGIVKTLASVAFDGYERYGTRMDRKWLEGSLGGDSETVTALKGAGVLTDADKDIIVFRHQLFHDFLAGCRLAELPIEEWRSSNFDVATLTARSFDALSFAVELLGEKSNEFIIEVYDWSYGAAFTCVLDLESGIAGGPSPVSSALRDALIALNAEKRFDLFENTRTKADKMASSTTVNTRINHKRVKSRDELLENVRLAYVPDGSFPLASEWLRIFTMTKKPGPKDWALLQHSPVLAWTAANAFRYSVEPKDEIVDYLIGLYESLVASQPEAERAVGTRWRIVHLFGAVDRPDVVETLFGAAVRECTKKTKWVQYGAMRGLVEIAAKRGGPDAANELLSRIVSAMPKLVGFAALTELRNIASIGDPSPPWWKTAYVPILEKGLELAKQKNADKTDIEAWDETLKQFKRASDDDRVFPGT